MIGDEILLLTGDDVLSLLSGREPEIVETARKAYLVHEAGESSLPMPPS